MRKERWPKARGAVAQLGEHLLCKQGVVGSIPISSTSYGQVRREGRSKRKGLLLAFSRTSRQRCLEWFFNKTEEVKRLARRSGITRERDSVRTGETGLDCIDACSTLSRGEWVTSANTCNARRDSA